MKYDVLFNFISPVTGRLCIPEDYILIGDGQGFSTPSPILMDMRLDITNLRRDVNDIFDTSFIIGFPDIDFPNAQVLSELENGFMYNTKGIVSTTPTIPISGLPDLTYKNLWIGDDNNRPIEQTKIAVDNLPDLGVGTVTISNPFDPQAPIVLTRGKIWRGTDSLRPEESNAVTALEAEGLLFTARFLTSAWILRNSGVIPNVLRLVLWPNTQFLDDLTTNSLLKHTTNGTIAVATLTFNAIWRGDANNIPQESQSLTTLETKVANIEDVLIPGLEAEIAALEAEIAALEAEITVIQGQITVLEGAVAILQGQILIIQGQIAAIDQRIDNLRLNNIPADGDVSFYNFKLINLADPVNQTDGVNLRTLITYINNVPTTIELTGDVTGSGNTGTPIETTLQLTLDQIKIAQNTVNLNDQKISNLKSDDVEQQDALNAKFLWDLMHDQVEVVWV